MLVSTQTPGYNAEIVQLQSALEDEYNSFSGNIKLIPHLRAIIGRLLQKIILVRSLRSNFIDSFKETLQLRGNTSQGVLAPFSFSHVIDYCFFFSLSLFFSRSFLIFMVTSDWFLTQLRICIAYKFSFQRKRNELQHRRLEGGVSKIW